MRAAGQEDQRSGNNDDEDDENDDCARHRPFQGEQRNGGLLPDHRGRCIAPMEKVRESLDRPIVLVGLMGAGKSTVGKRLAARLGLPFVDTDSEIESAAGLTAAEIFELYGEADFRDGERRVVARLMDGECKVIATGGGAFVDPRTRELLNKQAITVWLDAPVDILVERTARRDTRPLLRHGDPRETLKELAEKRRPAYSEAHIRIVTGNGAHGDVVEAILEQLATRLSLD